MNKKTNILTGIAAAPGLSISKAYLYQKETEEINEDIIENVDEAIAALDEALEKSKKELTKILGMAVDKLGEKRAAIFEAQIMILDDPVLISAIKKRIQTEKKLPEYIVNDEISKYQVLMDASNELYMKERSNDIEDIKNRVIRNLKKKKWKSQIQKDMVVVSQSITPADTILFTRVHANAYVTNFGGLTSHAAIVARSLNIPAVLGVRDATSRIVDGDTIIVDGFHGKVIINPDKRQLEYYKEKRKQLDKLDIELSKLRNKPAVTKDGHEVVLMANLDLMEEIFYIVNNGAKGIGLVRTEQLFDIYESFPEEETQYKVYKNLAEKIYPEKIIIRAFDIGGDKVLPGDTKEPNPFLGWRGIRILLDNIDMYKAQIRAVMRANIHKNLSFMLPMIASIAEIRMSKKIIRECENELRKEDCKYCNKLKLGIMIEVPSAAVMAKDFANEVDFISIGTNDLIQYLLAVDRGNEIVANQYQEFHPAVIRTLAHVIKESKASNATTSICGEMAADPIAIPILVGLGFDSLSVSPAAILNIKKIIRALSFQEAKNLVDEVLKLKTEKEIKNRLIKFNKEIQVNTEHIF